MNEREVTFQILEEYFYYYLWCYDCVKLL